MTLYYCFVSISSQIEECGVHGNCKLPVASNREITLNNAVYDYSEVGPSTEAKQHTEKMTQCNGSEVRL